MKTNLLIRLLPIAFTAACTSVSSPTSDDTFSLPDIPDSPQKVSIPYPKLDEQTQIDHLGVQVARIEREMEGSKPSFAANRAAKQNPLPSC